jgi:PAS domain S-box-containing protein
MLITDNYKDYSKEQLLQMLQELQLKYNDVLSSYKNDISEKKLIEKSLLTRAQLLSEFNQYSIELGDLKGPRMYQFIVTRFKELFKVRGVWISTYRDESSSLIIEASTATEEDNSILLKFLGQSAKSYRTPVTDTKYKLMMENLVKSHSSLNELSFGQIPEIISSAIQKVFNVGWFQGISLVDKGKLYGTMVVAGEKGQDVPDTDIIKLFAGITSNIIRRKQAEERLLLSEDKFKKAFVTSPDSVNINRLEDGMYVSINKGFTRMSGYTEDDVIGKTSVDLNIWAIPADREWLVNCLKEKGEADNFETTFIRKNGTVLYGIMSAAIIDLDGVPHILSITRDISDRKYAETAIRESENRYRELIELAVDGILLGSSDGTIIGANTCMLTLTGRSLSDLLGMHVSQLFDKASLNSSPLRFDLLINGETVMNERILLRPDNSLVPIEMRTRMMPDGTFQSIYRDISERRKAEKALIESEEKLQSIIRVAPVGIGLTVNRILAEVNDDLCKLTGYARNELINKSAEVLYPSKEEFERVGKDKYAQIAQKGTGTIETVFKCKDNRLLNVILSSTPLDRYDHSKGVTFTVLDVTERNKVTTQMKIAKEKAEASDKLKTSFLNNISHEVRTPLNGILGFAELISQKNLSESDRDVAVSMVYESSERLLRTITNYMDISMLTSGNMSFNIKNIDPSVVLKEIHNNFKPICSIRKLDLILDLPEDATNHSFFSDPEIIEKILSHFTDNAIKFTSAGHIRLGYTVKEKCLEFFVQDTGPGIAEKSLENIFNRFFKADIGADRIYEGSGLGLAISKGLAELTGGKVYVISHPGKGSTFFLEMPLTGIQIDTREETQSKTINLTGKKDTILIAEDDEINFFYLNALLSRVTGSRILHAENGRAAVEMFKANKDIGLILMDIKMPELDGLEATRQIKLINPDIPVIAITAYAMAGDEDRVLAAGCDGYLSKPIKRDILLSKLAEFVKI